MIHKTLWLFILCSALVLVFSGCRSITPAVSYYTLHAITDESAISEAGSKSPAKIIGIRSVSLPGVINRTQMVRQTGSYEIKMESFHRWADYPDRMISQLIGKNLQTLVPETRVVNAPWEVGLKADIVLSFQFLELMGSTDKKMALSVVWTLSNGEDASQILSRRTNLAQPINGNGLDDLAEAHSRILADLSREVATAIQTVLSSTF